MPFRNPFVPEETHFQRWLPFYASVTVVVLGGFTMLFCGGIAYLVLRKQPLP